MELEAHPIACMFPLVGRDELEKLARSIRARGLRNPIVLYEGKILDGRNRYEACKLVGVEPTTVEWDGPADDWVAAGYWALDQNTERRHLTVNQRAVAANRLRNLVAGRPRKTGARTPVSRAEAAERLGTTEDQVRRAAVVERSGVPELLEAVESNEVSLSGAAEVAKLPPAKQREILAGGKKAVAKAAEQQRPRAAAKAAKPTDDVLQGLTGAIQTAKKVVKRLSDSGLAVGASEREILGLAAGELRTLADWLDALAKGGPSDDDLSKLLGAS